MLSSPGERLVRQFSADTYFLRNTSPGARITAHSCHNLTYKNSVADTRGTGDSYTQMTQFRSYARRRRLFRLRPPGWNRSFRKEDSRRTLLNPIDPATGDSAASTTSATCERRRLHP